jgi:hypothetical protein
LLVFAKVHFGFDSVREHPRFQAILRELHLARRTRIEAREQPGMLSKEVVRTSTTYA